MKCSKCGAPIQLNQKYCPNCGSLNEENAKHVSDMENYDSNVDTAAYNRVLDSYAPEVLGEKLKKFFLSIR